MWLFLLLSSAEVPCEHPGWWIVMIYHLVCLVHAAIVTSKIIATQCDANYLILAIISMSDYCNKQMRELTAVREIFFNCLLSVGFGVTMWAVRYFASKPKDKPQD